MGNGKKHRRWTGLLCGLIFLLLLFSIPIWVWADTETIYPDNPGEARSNDFRYPVGCDPAEHYNCVGNESDDSYVYDSTATGGGGENSFDWVCGETWDSIDSIEIIGRAKNSGIFGINGSLAFGYWYNDGELWGFYEVCAINTGTSFSASSCVTDTNFLGNSWTQAMLEGNTYEFGFRIKLNDIFYKYVSSFKLTIRGTTVAAAEGNPRRNREIRKMLRGEANEEMGFYARLNPANWRE